MAFQPVPDSASIVIEGEMADGVTWVQSYNLQNAGGVVVDQTQADLIAANYNTSLIGNDVDDLLSTTWHALSLTFTDLSTEFGAQYTADLTGCDGLATGNPLPNGAAALISWRTNTRSRNARGRTYFGGFTEADSLGNGLSATLVSNLQDWASQWINDLESYADNMVVVSRYEGVDPVTHKPIPRAEGLTFPITTALVHPSWKSQRRRNLKS